MEQLNKFQIKAELLTVLSKLQTNVELSEMDKLLQPLYGQDDKKTILDLLIKELVKSEEQRAMLICFLLLNLCDETELEEALWKVLKNQSVSDAIKSLVLNVLNDLGKKVDYEKLDEYFENPNNVIDADTQKLLKSAIINPEAQIDFLDFVNSLSDIDKKVLVRSLGDDYEHDALANILNPLVLYSPDSEIGRIAIDILGETKSQLALHNLAEALEFVDNDVTKALIKKNISSLKIAGIREDNSVEFYKSILQSKPYSSYTSYPDGHGNQAVIFSRERDDETIQMTAIVLNDTYGLIDCFGFNEISKPEFEKIVNKFYKGDEHVYINSPVIKRILLEAEKLTRKTNSKISYEYLCWKNILIDIDAESVPIELTLKSQLEQKELTDKELEDIYMFDFIQRWFFDVDYNENFKSIIAYLNDKIAVNDFDFDLELIVGENLDSIFVNEIKDLYNKRILMSSYLKYLAGEKDDAQKLYSLYNSEDKKLNFYENIIRKSIYESYVLLKFKLEDSNKTTNIFTMKNTQRETRISPKQVEEMIMIIESLWVK